MIEQPAGGYWFVPGGLRFAANGVVAAPGMSIERAVLASPVAVPDGYDAVRAHLESIGRPLDALCGTELRMPAVATLAEFTEFNGRYIAYLDSWGLLRDGRPPLTRTYVAPAAAAPPAPSLLAFSYTVPGDDPSPTFVVSGIPELPAGAPYPDGIVHRGRTDADALGGKLEAAIDAVAGHIAALGAVWDDAATVHAYSHHDIVTALLQVLQQRLAIVPTDGIVYHRAAPPVAELELEVDVRRYCRQVIVHP